MPLTLLLHPYAGIVQDARIYIGRGVADRDPNGVGHDVMFALDEQTRFSLMRGLVDAALGVMGPGAAGVVLTSAGAALWLAAAVALARSLAKGRDAWAAVACVVALPTFYGAYRVFDYAEAVATPRVFAEAAVLGGLAVLMGGPPGSGRLGVRRLGAGLALFALAMAFHPLMALPGIAVGAALLVRRDPRWLLALAAGTLAIVAAAVLHLPIAVRLALPMDDAWLALLRQRSIYLFPSLWPAASFAPILCQATAVIVAAAVTAPAVRALLLAGLGVALSGLAVSWLWGDLHASTLVVQLQPWRALWLLAAFGNAALALAATALWRRGTGARMVLAPLALTWLWSNHLWLAVPSAVLTLCGLAAMLRHALPAVSSPVRRACAATLCAVAVLTTSEAASVGLALVRSAREEGARVGWAMLLGLGIQTVPVGVAILAAALLAPARPSAWSRRGLVAAFACGCAVAAWQWDGRPVERLSAERGGTDPALQAAIGPSPGDVMWVDEDSQTWFLAGRPSFFSSIQGAPILFSRALALEWADRAAFARRLGLARESAVAPWAVPHPRLDPLVPKPESVALFCASPRRPAAIVAPGEQLDAAPPGYTVRLWRPGSTVRRPWLDDETIRWTSWDVYTVIRCPQGPADARSRDARSLG